MRPIVGIRKGKAVYQNSSQDLKTKTKTRDTGWKINDGNYESTHEYKIITSL